MESKGIFRLDTPVLVAFVGLGLALVEGTYDLLNPGLYAGEFGGVTVTETDIIISTAVAMGLVVVALAYLYSHRSDPRKKTYVFVGVLGVLSLVIGVLLSTIIVIGAAIFGYSSVRTAVTEKSGKSAPASLSHSRRH